MVSVDQRGSFLHPFAVVQVELIGQQIWLPEQSASDTQVRAARMAASSSGGAGTDAVSIIHTTETTIAANTSRRITLLFMASSST